MKFLFVSFFLVISYFSFAQIDSVTYHQNGFPKRSILSNPDNYSVHNFVPISSCTDLSITKPYIYLGSYNDNFLGDINESMRGIQPGEALFLIAANYLIYAIDKKSFFKPSVKKRFPLLKSE